MVINGIAYYKKVSVTPKRDLIAWVYLYRYKRGYSYIAKVAYEHFLLGPKL